MRTAVYHKEENLIELRLDGGSLWINEMVIQHVLDMPPGSDKEPEASEDHVEEEYGAMWMLLHAVSTRYPDEFAGRGQKVQQQSPPQRSISRSNNASSSQTRRATPQSYLVQRKMFTPTTIQCLFRHWHEQEFSDLVTELGLVRLFLAVKVERLLLPT
jgi:hypothetical protein